MTIGVLTIAQALGRVGRGRVITHAERAGGATTTQLGPREVDAGTCVLCKINRAGDYQSVQA